MNIQTSTPRWVRVALLACALASTATGTSLLAQQAQGPAASTPAAAVQAPAQAPAATPASSTAPHESALFQRDDPNAPTLASAQAAHESAMSSGDNHTIVVSTLVLVLAVVILVLLIA